MKQVIRKGLRDIIVDEVPDPVLLPHHVLVRPIYSLISSGTETASIHRDSLLSEVADNPSHLRKMWEVAMIESARRQVPIEISEEIGAGRGVEISAETRAKTDAL